MSISRFLSVSLSLACGVVASANAKISAIYTPINSQSWNVDFTLNLLDWSEERPTVGGFTIQFDPELLVQLSLASSAPGWDSLVLQPDPALPAGGVLDSLVLDPADVIAQRMLVTGFSINANFSVEYPAILPPTFRLYDVSGNTASSGIVEVSVVPEPSAVWVLLAGLVVLAGAQYRRGFQNRGA